MIKRLLQTLCLFGIAAAFVAAEIEAKTPDDMKQAIQTMNVIKAERLINHARIVSDAKYRGRAAGLKGSRLTSDYLVKNFKQWQIRPGGSAGTFYQTFKIQTGYKISSNLQLTTGGLSIGDFTRKTDYSLVHLVNNKASLQADLAFAGFGISMPEQGFDEYANLDVKGKAVIVFAGTPWVRYPKKWQALTKNNHLKYSNLSYKAQNAARLGATCLLIVDNPADWKSGVEAKRSFRVPDFNSKIDSPIPIIHISQEIFEKTVSMSEEELFELSNDISKDKQPESMLLRGRKLELTASVQGKARVGRNIIGVIPGSDRTLRHEAIVIGAHYDHLGHEDDTIFFGANDNASGVAALLGVAEAFSKKPAPKRSVIFIAFDGEEIGKLGSKFFVKHSIVARDQLIFMINFDMVGKNKPNEINVVASRSSNQGHEIHQVVNQHVGLKLNHPRSYRLGRSDHSPFFKADIPVIYLFGGLDPEYNTPQDTWEKLIPDKLEKVSRLAYLTAFYISTLEKKVDFSGYQEPKDNKD